MLKCRNCGEKLTKFNKEFCPYCGVKNPIEKFVDSSDTTQAIDKIKEEDLAFNEKSYKVYSLFSIFLGFFSVDLFYLGFTNLALIRLLVNFGLWLVAFLTIYLINNSLVLIAIFVPLAFLYFLYLLYGIFKFFKMKNNLKDKNGVYLK